MRRTGFELSDESKEDRRNASGGKSLSNTSVMARSSMEHVDPLLGFGSMFAISSVFAEDRDVLRD